MQGDEKEDELNNQRAEDIACGLVESAGKKSEPKSQKPMNPEPKSQSSDNLKHPISDDRGCGCVILSLMLLALLLVPGNEAPVCLAVVMFFIVLLLMSGPES